MTTREQHPAYRISPYWRRAQVLAWIAGAALLVLLVAAPPLGLSLLWNVLIPAAPLLLILAPGVWRNICPLGSTALFARHVNRSARRKISPSLQGKLNLIGLLILFLILPLRHLFFDTSGPASAVLLLSFGIVALVVGTITEWKSGWCAGLCPVHPVEKLYGSNPVMTTANAHCSLCEQCVVPCPDSTKGITPLTIRKNRIENMTGTLMVGGFPGFIWGWFQVPDYRIGEGGYHLAEAYLWPLGGMMVSLLLFLLLRSCLGLLSRASVRPPPQPSPSAAADWGREPRPVGAGGGVLCSRQQRNDTSHAASESSYPSGLCIRG